MEGKILFSLLFSLASTFSAGPPVFSDLHELCPKNVLSLKLTHRYNKGPTRIWLVEE